MPTSDLRLLLSRHARERGGQPYLEQEAGPPLDYAELWRRVCGLHEQFEGFALPPGSRFLLPMANTVDCAVLLLGAMAAGRVPIITSPFSPAAYLDEIGRRAEASALIRPASQHAGANPTSVTVLEVDARRAHADQRWPHRHSAEDAYILFTSGSTGRPKGIRTSYRALRSKRRGMTLGYGLSPSDRHLCVLPCQHVSGIYHHLLMALELGATVVLRSGFEPAGFFRLLVAERVGFVQLVPTLISALVAGSEEPAPTIHETLRFVGSGSAPLPLETLQGFERRFGILVAQCYGMTEAACAMTLHRPSSELRRVASVGKALPGNEVQVWTERGEVASPGEIGEVVVRGDNLLTGYVGDDPPLRMEDGWLRTGDNAYFDEAGFLFHMGRRDEMFKRGGFLIYPREIEEAVLAALPEAVEVAALGVEHPRLGRDLVCWVAFGPNPPLRLREMVRRLREILPPERLPSDMIPIEQLPRIKGVKVDKLALDQLYRNRKDRTD